MWFLFRWLAKLFRPFLPKPFLIRHLGEIRNADIHQKRSDAAKLSVAGLPVLHSLEDVAEAVGITNRELAWLTYHQRVATIDHYTRTEIPKRSGGTRTLMAPKPKLARAQTWVLRNILDHLPAEPCAHGFLPEHSIVTNAKPHVGKAIVINMDLEAFFPSITYPRVRGIFRTLGYSPAVAAVLALLCTESPRRKVRLGDSVHHVATGDRALPQGACTSPALSNQVARKLDRRLQGLARKLGITYTRYADDLTFSANARFEERIGYLLARARHIAEDEGFAINMKKTRVQRRNARQSVTGLVVNEKVNVNRDEIRRIRAILHQARLEGLDKQNREGRPDFVAWLRGKIAFIAMARPELGEKFRQELRAVLQSKT